MKISIKILIN